MVFLLHSNSILKSSLIGGFSTGFNDISTAVFFLLGHRVEQQCSAAKHTDWSIRTTCTG